MTNTKTKHKNKLQTTGTLQNAKQSYEKVSRRGGDNLNHVLHVLYTFVYAFPFVVCLLIICDYKFLFRCCFCLFLFFLLLVFLFVGMSVSALMFSCAISCVHAFDILTIFDTIEKHDIILINRFEKVQFCNKGSSH